MDKTGIRLLCLSYRAAPELRPQAMLIGKMVPEWIRQGLHPVIVSYENGKEWDLAAPVYRLPVPKFIPLISRIPAIARLQERWFNFRDFCYVAQIIRKHRINLVYSFAKPVESNILAATIRRRLGIPCIAHWSDPWYDSPLRDFSGALKRVVLEYEQQIVGDCDHSLFVSEQLRRLVMRKFPKEWMAKSSVVPHCFDPAEFGHGPVPDPKTFTITHAGAFYTHGRDPRTLCVALAKLIARRPELTVRLRVQLVGGINAYAGFTAEALETLVRDAGLVGIVHIMPSVTYHDSLALIQASDCLCVIDLDLPECPFLPSKIFDYLGSGRPIIGIMGDASASAEVLRKAGCSTFGFDKAEELSRCIETMMDGKKIAALNGDYIRGFTVERTTQSLIGLFKKVLDSQQARP